MNHPETTDCFRRTTALIILDGWGYREESQDNAIKNANTPFMDKAWQDKPHTLINTSGIAVGLPEGQMGNSEVGHMNLGAGRIVYQNFTRITADIKNHNFFKNIALTSAINKAVNLKKKVHILGLLSPGGVHSHENQIKSACELAIKHGATQIFVHAFLDGRDTPPKSADESINKLDDWLRSTKKGRIASIIGRYYAMDRDNRWERIEEAWKLMVEGKAEFHANTARKGLSSAYERGETDEFVKATLIADTNDVDSRVQDGDSVIFMNFRADRARELTRSFVDSDFIHFEQKYRPALSEFVMLTKYAADINAKCAYSPTPLTNSLGEYMEKLGKTQLRIAETEKYAHVTFFFSGGREQEYQGENRVMVPSPKVATYDLKPEMSAPELTNLLITAINEREYDLIICNFANGDMVGHTGQYDAAVKAAECLDHCLQKIVGALLVNNGQALITADHGNAELMTDPVTGQPHTAHTTLPVPLIYVGQESLKLKSGGKLSDIAPSILDLMQLPKPDEMTGTSLIIQ